MRDDIVEFLKGQVLANEGLRLKMYRCPAGHNTIGVGHNLDAKPISRRAAMVIFEDDLNDAIEDVARALPWTDRLAGPRWAVFVDMAMNMGLGELMRFKKMLAAAMRGDWPVAARELIDSDYGRGVTRERAERNAQQLLTGEWQ